MTNAPTEPLTGSATTTIAAPINAVYAAVTDVTRMGEWSPECTTCRWVGDATGPAVDAETASRSVSECAEWHPHLGETQRLTVSAVFGDIDVRVPADTAIAGGSHRATTEGWVRLRDGTPPTVLSLPLFADAFPPSLFAKLGSVGWVPTIDLTVHVRRRPVDGWIQARFECDDLVGGRMIESGTFWDQTGRVVARSRQLGLLLGT